MGSRLARALTAATLPGLEHDPDRVRDTARELLSRPPYRDDAGPVAQALRWLRRQVAEALSNFLSALELGSAGAWAVALLGLVLLAVAVWFWTRGLVVDRSVATVPAAEPAKTVAEWLADADQHARAQRWRDALRCRYGALVAALTAAGIVEDVPGRTVRELTAEVSAEVPSLAAVVGDVGARFEAVWYGNTPASDEDAEVALRAVEAVRRVGRSEAVPA